uniref:Uncharacterized protein n=1 Tax=Ammopiptanthus mongolicus TaxID=126911 RepID=A0A4P8PJZ5_AMMMO|nr:hypothetical protein [Ammopiptanthus mongolicus]
MEGGAYITGCLLTKPSWLFAPLAFFLPETMPFLDTDLQTKSDEELASLKVALADLPVPLLSRFWAVLPPAAYSFTASMPRAYLLLYIYLFMHARCIGVT